MDRRVQEGRRREQGIGECKMAKIDGWYIASKRAGARDRRVQDGQGMGECKRAGEREDKVQEGRRDQGMGDCKRAKVIGWFWARWWSGSNG